MITFKSENVDGKTRSWQFESIDQIRKIWNSEFPDLPANDDAVWDIIINEKEITGEFSFEDIFDLEQKADCSKEVTKAEPIYTGGNIYVFFVKKGEDDYFIADSCNFDVMAINKDPWEDGYKKPFYCDWQKEHVTGYLDEDECLKFFKEMLNWILENKPTGNYLEEDMRMLLGEVKALEGTTGWR